MDDFSCDNYSADDEQIQKDIDDFQKEFYRGYSKWQRIGSPADIGTMERYFQDKEEIKTKLLAGVDGGRGGVLTTDCGKFLNFIGPVSPSIDTEFAAANGITFGETELDKQWGAFQVALGKYVLGRDLSPREKSDLNGALFVQVGITSLRGTEDRRLFVLPYYQLSKNEPPLVREWKKVDEMITQALDAVRAPTINVRGAVQLRFGSGSEDFKPITVGDGMVIMGRA
jgi:hypothetical protein